MGRWRAEGEAGD
uniref:Uncharacterized protein n=1 Tax=Arundo donax TaxID=35708 RepID=A0A0A9BIL0_ARUDO